MQNSEERQRNRLNDDRIGRAFHGYPVMFGIFVLWIFRPDNLKVLRSFPTELAIMTPSNGQLIGMSSMRNDGLGSRRADSIATQGFRQRLAGTQF